MKQSHEIQGWFDYPNTFEFLVSTIPDDGIFVECGAWLGASSSYLCDIAKDRINIFIVDTWKGSKSEIETHHKLATKTDIYKIFINNMGDRKFTPIRKKSSEAVNDFDDNSCDVVYIDMEHTYESTKNDIEMWLKKVKYGGYLAGHDYCSSWRGVIKAVDELLGKNNISIMNTNSWIYRKNKIKYS